jgi:hypothetical protein
MLIYVQQQNKTTEIQKSKLPVIKHLTQFIEDNDQDYIVETIEVLEMTKFHL